MSTQNTTFSALGLAAATSKSCFRATGVVAALAITLTGGTAWSATGLADSPPVQQQVRLAATIMQGASEQGGCGPGFTLMRVRKVLPIAAPASASAVKAADANGDGYLCVKIPRGGGPTQFVDNSDGGRERRGGNSGDGRKGDPGSGDMKPDPGSVDMKPDPGSGMNGNSSTQRSERR